MILTASQVYHLLAKVAQQVAPRFNQNPTSLAQIATAIAFVESRFNTEAQAPKPHTAKGLLQVNNITKKDAERILGLEPAPMEKMFDPEYNALLGLTILAYRINRCKTVDLGVVAFNQGNCGIKAQIAARGYLKKWKNAMRNYAYLMGPIAMAPKTPVWY